MSNKTLLKLSVMCVLTAAASTAAYAADISASTTIGNATFSPSSNVTITVVASDAAYGAYSQHLNGNRMFFSNNGDPKLYYNTKATGSTVSCTPVTTGTVPSGFSSL